MKFKLLAGLHVQKEDSGQVDDKGNSIKVSKVYGKGQEGGSTIESDTDLVQRFGSDKFQYLEGPPPRAKKGKKGKEGTEQPQGPIAGAQTPAVFPGGQVSSGHQQSTSLPDGTVVSGPLTKEVNQTQPGVQETPKGGVRGAQTADAFDQAKAQGQAQEQRDDDEESSDSSDQDNSDYEGELEEMTVPELKKHAQQEEIDLGNARTKQEIIEKILSAQ